MKIGWILFKKELLESARNYKWLWMPVIFVLFGLTEPLTAYYLPDILNSVGDLPEGTIIEIPTPSSGEVLISTIGQFNTFGVLIIVLAFMGIVSGERKSGRAAMVLVKPISYSAYIYSKWLASMVLVWSSYIVGMLASWYYINLLFEDIKAGLFLQTLGVYGVWLTFILTLVIFFSSLVKTSGLAAFYTLGISIILTFLSSSLPETLKWSPAQLTVYSSNILLQKTWPHDLTITLLFTGLFCLLIMIVVPSLFKKKELT